MPYDLLLKNGRIVDGSGLPSIWGDIGVAGGKIVEVGRLDGPARRVIDVHGQTIGSPALCVNRRSFDSGLLAASGSKQPGRVGGAGRLSPDRSTDA
jgi:cytosine/adenosine deaminase-related metal-dependent hydrolase